MSRKIGSGSISGCPILFPVCRTCPGRLWLHGPWSELAKSGDAFLSLVQEWDEEETVLSRQSSASSSSSEAPERNVDELISLPECQSAIGSVLGALEGRRIDAALIRSVQDALSGSADQADLVREGAATRNWLNETQRPSQNKCQRTALRQQTDTNSIY